MSRLVSLGEFGSPLGTRPPFAKLGSLLVWANHRAIARKHSLTSIRFVSRIAAEVTGIEKEACASSDKLHSEGVPFVTRRIINLWGSFSQRSFFA